jgi:hypothetical protein
VILFELCFMLSFLIVSVVFHVVRRRDLEIHLENSIREIFQEIQARKNVSLSRSSRYKAINT